MANLTKHCPRCDTEKSLSEFSPRRSRKSGDGIQSHCKSCKNAYHRAYRAAHPKATRSVNWKSQGIDPNAAWTMLEDASGCELCGSQDHLVIDHCHKTGRLRGVLCSPCNRSLGKLGDNVEGIQKALTYLEVSTNG